MAGFNAMEGFTIAKNPWRNSKYGKGPHYFRTSTPRQSNTDEQQRVREAFADAAKSASNSCSNLNGMARNECQLEEVSQRMQGE